MYIRKRTSANGVISYRAEIVIKNHGFIVHRESKTFSKQKIAKDWAMRREVELQQQSVYKIQDRIEIKQLIDQYLRDYPPAGRTKLFDLNKLMKTEIASHDIFTLTARDLIRHVKERNKTALPQTANNDLIWLKTVLKTMRAATGLKYDLEVFDDAREVLRREGLIAKSQRRDRRPTKEELFKLSRYFYGKPMLHIMWIAIFSARRQSEITRLRWDDIDHQHKTIIVRNLKHPSIKKLNKKSKLPRSAYKLIMKQPKQSEFIFPISSKAISAYFTRACHLLDIHDLRFHDLRHHAVSLLFEAGLSIVEVQQISLHTTWDSLARYVNLNPGNIDI